MKKYRQVYLLIAAILAVGGCAKKNQEVCDPNANLDPELSDTSFLKIKRGRPLTEQEQKALAYRGNISFNLSVQETEEVQTFFQYFNEDKRGTMDRWISRAAPHLAYVRAVLASYKLPPDLIVLPFIESGYNNFAYSCAGAGGMWQFMPATGRRYGLTVDWWVDERRNPYLATVAAAKYLGELYAMFNDWNLALAGYNAGEGKVSRAMAKSGIDNFFDLAKDKNLLKQETKHYVPKFLAVLKIFQNLEALGYKQINWDVAQVMEEVQVPGGTDLLALAQACDMSWEEFSTYNGGFRRQVSPPDRTSPVYVPKPKTEKVQAFLAAPDNYPPAGYRAYAAADNETWWAVSRRSGVPVAELRLLNPNAPEVLSSGLTLKIPNDGSSVDSSMLAMSAEPSPKPVQTRAGKYKVKHGDTIASVAKHFGVSESELMRANKIKTHSGLSSGKNLVIPQAVSAPAQDKPVQTAYAKATESQAKPLASSTYVVKKGESLASIAARQGLDQKSILQASGLSSAKEVKPGTRLKLPAAQAAAVQPVSAQPLVKPLGQASAKSPAKSEKAEKKAAAVSAKTQPAPQAAAASSQTKPAEAVKSKSLRYNVANGETVYSIARKFKVDPSAIINSNNLNKNSQLKAGDKLTIPQN